jgi:hypothetical protein
VLYWAACLPEVFPLTAVAAGSVAAWDVQLMPLRSCDGHDVGNTLRHVSSIDASSIHTSGVNAHGLGT